MTTFHPTTAEKELDICDLEGIDAFPVNGTCHVHGVTVDGELITLGLSKRRLSELLAERSIDGVLLERILQRDEDRHPKCLWSRKLPIGAPHA